MTVFETIRTDDEIEDAVISTLRRWLPTYMSEVERQLGVDVGFYQRPFLSSYTTRTDFEVWPEEMKPVITVVAAGIDDDPVRTGKGKYRARYPIGVINTCSSVDDVHVRRYASRMGAAIRVALIQHPSLDMAFDGTVRGIDFVGSRNNELPSQDERTIRAYRQLFVVEVDDVMTRGAGPATPDPPVDPGDPIPDWGIIPDEDHVVVTTEVLDD